MPVINSWLLYKKVTGKKCTLGAYREELAVSLCRGGIDTIGKDVEGNQMNQLSNNKKSKN